MMKKIFFGILITFIAFSANAQLSNTKWKGTLNIQGGMNVVFNFSHDTLDVVNTDDNQSLETMKYTLTDSVITLQKLTGSSQCNESTAGKYKYAIANNDMTLNLISDDCNERSSAIGTLKLNKQ